MNFNVGVIGLGVGESHIQAYRALSNCKVSSICDFSNQKLAEVRARYPDISRAVTSADEVLNDPSINLVSIASYDNFHHEQIIKAIRNKKHVFVEKPLCLSLQQAREIRDELVKHPGIRLTSNLVLRRSPRFLALKELVDRGELGQLFLIEGDYNYGRVHKILNGWRGEIDNYSPVFGGGVHIIDLFLWLTKCRVKEVSALGSKLITQGTSYRYYDTVVALLKFENGIIGKLGVNLGCVYPHFHRFSAYGSKATFENGLSSASLFRSYDKSTGPNDEQHYPAPEQINAPYPGITKGVLISEFIDSIVSNRESSVTTQEIFDAMSVCFAIEDSSKLQKPVNVTYL